MNRHIVIFIVTFAVGAVIAVILRTGSHKPYAEHRGHPAPGAASAAPATAYDAPDAHGGHAMPPAPAAGHGDHGAMPMPAPTAPVQLPSAPAPAPVSPDLNAQSPAVPTTSAVATVNTDCPICGMPVKLALGTIAYKGKLVGFGCKTCPAKFRAEPAKYGEAALKNQVLE